MVKGRVAGVVLNIDVADSLLSLVEGVGAQNLDDVEGVLLVGHVAGHDEWDKAEVLLLAIHVGVVLEELQDDFVVVIPVGLDGEVQWTEGETVLVSGDGEVDICVEAFRFQLLVIEKLAHSGMVVLDDGISEFLILVLLLLPPIGPGVLGVGDDGDLALLQRLIVVELAHIVINDIQLRQIVFEVLRIAQADLVRLDSIIFDVLMLDVEQCSNIGLLSRFGVYDL